jgi:RNA polymerase sigma-70 factor (ECF subfamily)
VPSIEFVERAARGDRDAFDVLVGDVLDRLYAVARLILRDADLAEDAVRDALVHCWRELPRLRDPLSFDAWLHRLLVNAATDQHRKRRRIRASISTIKAEPVQHDFSIDVMNEDQVRIGFERLRVEHRTVLVMYHYLGLSVSEIGEVLGIPSGTVKSRMHYASGAMRAVLEADARGANHQGAAG